MNIRSAARLIAGALIVLPFCVVALTLQWLIGGLFIVEIVFEYPGIGQGLVQAVIARDIPLVQAVAMIIATVYVLITIIADIVVVLLVPKLRTTV